MRKVSSCLLILLSLLLPPKSAAAQNAVDTETIRKADEIMAKIKTANGDDRLLASLLFFLAFTKGLSAPCQTLLMSMKSIASKPSDNSDEVKLATERKACVGAASTEASEPVSTPHAKP